MNRAYGGGKTRTLAVELGYIPVVPPKSNRKGPLEYDKEFHKQRNQVERFFRRLKRFCATPRAFQVASADQVTTQRESRNCLKAYCCGEGIRFVQRFHIPSEHCKSWGKRFALCFSLIAGIYNFDCLAPFRQRSIVECGCQTRSHYIS